MSDRLILDNNCAKAALAKNVDEATGPGQVDQAVLAFQEVQTGLNQVELSCFQRRRIVKPLTTGQS